MSKLLIYLPPGGLASVPKDDRPRYIRALLTAANISNEELADLTNKSTVYISNIINGQRTGYGVRRLIAKRLGYGVSDLWPDTPSQYLEAA